MGTELENSKSQPAGVAHDLGGIPAPEHRARVRALVLAIFVIVLCGPLTYYLGSDPYDERFSWRMFSAVRVRTCDTSVVEDVGGTDRPVNLRTAIHGAWVETLRRNRPAVIEKLLRHRCEGEGVASVTLTNQCTSPSGRRLPPIAWSIDCETHRIQAPENLE